MANFRKTIRKRNLTRTTYLCFLKISTVAAIVCLMTFHIGSEGVSCGSLLLSTSKPPAERAYQADSPPPSTTWPAIRYDKLADRNGKGQNIAPLVRVGSSFVEDRNILRSNLLEFIEVYRQRPEKDNTCGIRINHAYALWLTIRQLKPKMIIESGVNSGVSTWIMRQAAPSSETVIVSLDPEDKPICRQPVRWLDEVNQDRYLGKKDFVDLTQIDWGAKMKEHNVQPNEVLVYIDDHRAFFPRVVSFLKYGLLHIILEDNYALGEGATPDDKWSTPKQLFAGGLRPNSPEDAAWLLNQMEVYAEFPPLLSGQLAPKTKQPRKQGGFLAAAHDRKTYEEPILRPEENAKDEELFHDIANRLGLDPTMTQGDVGELSYTQFMNYEYIAYMKLHPFAPTLRKSLQSPDMNSKFY